MRLLVHLKLNISTDPVLSLFAAITFSSVQVEAVHNLCLRYPRKYKMLLKFLAAALREDGGFQYKKQIVESILDLMKQVAASKELGTRFLSNPLLAVANSYRRPSSARLLSFLCVLLCLRQFPVFSFPGFFLGDRSLCLPSFFTHLSAHFIRSYSQFSYRQSRCVAS